MFVDDDIPSFHDGKFTGDDRLLLGYGDTNTTLQTQTPPLHRPHLEHLTKFLQRFTGMAMQLEYAWSGIYSLSRNPLPYVAINEREAVLAGSGTQIASIALAEYVAHVLTGRAHRLDPLFNCSGQVRTRA